MRDTKSYSLIGGVLILIGVIILLGNFGLLGPIHVSTLIMGMLFGGGGLVFLAVYASNREQWWALIPGMTLLGLGVIIALSDYGGAWLGTIFLGSIGLSFWLIYMQKRDFWWAVIPGGVLFTLALVAGLSEIVPGEFAGGVFFLGLAATFAAVYVLPTPEGQMRWALIPAGILGVMGVLVMFAFSSWANYFWPAALIVAGLYLVYRNLTVRRN